MSATDFWWQQAGAHGGPWYDESDQQNLAELVGMTSGTYGSTMSPALQKSLAGLDMSFKLPQETLRSAPPPPPPNGNGNGNGLRYSTFARPPPPPPNGNGNGNGLRYSTFAPRENLRSRGNYPSRGGPPPAGDDCLSGIGCGLGTTWIDPRFEPGPQVMYPQGDTIYAHGGHAGGPTFGALMPAVFQTGGPRWSIYDRGYGDGRLLAPCAPRRR